MRVDSAALLDGQTCHFGDFNVFVGGNGVGKTTFVSELYRYSARSQRNDRQFWIQTTQFSSRNAREDLDLLKKSFQTHYDGANMVFHSRGARDINGNPDRGGDTRFSVAEKEQIEGNTVEIFHNWKYRYPFISFANADTRLSMNDQVGKTNFRESAGDSLNVLYRHPDQLAKVHRKILERFGFHLVLLEHTGTNIELGVSIQPPPDFDRNSRNVLGEFERMEAWKRTEFTPLAQAGHGIRSMVRLLTMLLEPLSKVLMIDEPEMHLYPKQRRWLGQQLVELAKDTAVQVFLVTHDPIILQGILDSAVTTKIFRIERQQNGIGTIRACDLAPAGGINSVSNQEQYLQGMFYQRCIVVEGPSDRVFYQAFEESFPGVEDKDVGFIACGGKGGTKNFAYLAEKVGLTRAFIYDFDAILFNQDVVRDVFVACGGSGDPLAQLNIAMELSDSNTASSDNKIRTKAVKTLTGYTEKEGAISDWAKKNATLFEKIEAELAQKRIFLVPRGALESWAPSIEPKSRFAELAPNIIRGDPTLLIPINAFLSKVLGSVDAL